MQVTKKSILFFGKKLMSTKHLSLDRTLFFHHNFGEAILKRHPAMRRQNCFQNRLFLYFWATFPWTFGGLSVVLLAWCGLGATVFCHFLVSSLWFVAVFCVKTSGCCPSGLVWFGGDRFLSFPYFVSVIFRGFLVDNPAIS